MATFKLTYFNAPGRAEPIRMALHLAGLAFEDHRIAFPEFVALKSGGELPLGSVPVLDVDGFKMTQTGAILRYIARLGAADLYPSDAATAFIVDSALDTFNDTLSNALAPSMRERDQDKKLEMRKDFVAGPFALACGYVEGLCARGEGPFLTGSELSIADLVVGNQIAIVQSGTIDGLSAETLAPYPRLVALAAAYQVHPRIVAYKAR